jgi:iron complex outermembrane receptor protein
MEVQAYLQHIENYIYLKPNGLDLTIRGAYPSFDWENTTALFRGIDYSFQLEITPKLKLSSMWSFLWANDQGNNSYLVMIPANRTQNSLTYQLELKEDKFLQFELGNQYVFRQNRFDPEEEIAPPPDAYQLFHASVSMPFSYRKVKGKLGLQLNNALNTVYRDYLNRFRFYTDEQGRNLKINLKINF